ncbi:MAG TPA: hypothetical protein VMV92_24250 [Streptosporangiaceae bacterium]|nr:hypothetical protein [Streptosporangiaceae bacterium]
MMAGRGARRQRGGPYDAALRLLGERLARGEIGIDEYTSRRGVLHASRRPAASGWRPGMRFAVTAAAVGLAGAALAAAVAAGPGPWYAPWAASRATCTAPALPGEVVDVTLTDMMVGMMGGGTQGDGGMMRVLAGRASVAGGTVSLRVTNTGALTHELVVLPLTAGQQPGSRPGGPDGTVSETGSLGEASATCGAGHGDGIAPGAVSWLTLTLRPGRYELICNLPGHYAMGMHTELDVR